MTEEIWKDVVGWEGLYQVSSLGRVKSLPRLNRTPTTTYISKERLLTPQLSKGGYYRVVLSKDGKSKHFFIHRLVAEAFIGVNKGMTINHKDEDKSNNRADNLEYMTRAENVRYGTGIKRSAASRKISPKICIAVNQYSIDGHFIKRYISSMSAIEENNWKGCGCRILLSCRRKLHTAYGYVWRFDGDTDASFKKGTNARKVLQFDKNGMLIGEYDSLESASIQTNSQKGHICSCCQGKRKTTNGFIWRYKE